MLAEGKILRNPEVTAAFKKTFQSARAIVGPTSHIPSWQDGLT